MSSGARLSSNCSMRGRGGFPWSAAGLDPPRSPRERSRPPYGRAPLADHHLCHHPAPITHHDSVSRQCASCALDLMDLVICILVGSPARRPQTPAGRRRALGRPHLQLSGRLSASSQPTSRLWGVAPSASLSDRIAKGCRPTFDPQPHPKLEPCQPR